MHSLKKLGCAALSLAMALTLLPVSALAARGDKDDTLSPEYTYSNNGYTLAVSYTHLDVYKRQPWRKPRPWQRAFKASPFS